MSDEDWQQKLTPQQYAVMREGETEAPFSGALLHNDKTGDYACAGCGTILFDSNTKFDSGSGWPSFYDVKDASTVRLLEDRSQGLQRIEIRCKSCDSHLGHVFHDAPDQPTGLRFCINSCALDFREKE